MQLLYVLKCGSGKRKKIDGVRAVRLFNIKLRYTTTLVQTFAFSQPVVVLRALQFRSHTGTKNPRIKIQGVNYAMINLPYFYRC